MAINPEDRLLSAADHAPWPSEKCPWWSSFPTNYGGSLWWKKHSFNPLVVDPKIPITSKKRDPALLVGQHTVQVSHLSPVFPIPRKLCWNQSHLKPKMSKPANIFFIEIPTPFSPHLIFHRAFLTKRLGFHFLLSLLEGRRHFGRMPIQVSHRTGIQQAACWDGKAFRGEGAPDPIQTPFGMVVDAILNKKGGKKVV